MSISIDLFSDFISFLDADRDGEIKPNEEFNEQAIQEAWSLAHDANFILMEHDPTLPTSWVIDYKSFSRAFQFFQGMDSINDDGLWGTFQAVIDPQSSDDNFRDRLDLGLHNLSYTNYGIFVEMIDDKAYSLFKRLIILNWLGYSWGGMWVDNPDTYPELLFLLSSLITETRDYLIGPNLSLYEKERVLKAALASLLSDPDNHYHGYKAFCFDILADPECPSDVKKILVELTFMNREIALNPSLPVIWRLEAIKFDNLRWDLEMSVSHEAYPRGIGEYKNLAHDVSEPQVIRQAAWQKVMALKKEYETTMRECTNGENMCVDGENRLGKYLVAKQHHDILWECWTGRGLLGLYPACVPPELMQQRN